MADKLTGEQLLIQLKESGTPDTKLLAIRERIGGKKITVQSVIEAANQLGHSGTAQKACQLAEMAGCSVNTAVQLAAEVDDLREHNRKLVAENETLRNKVAAFEAKK